MNEEKQALRIQMRQLLKSLPTSYRTSADQAISDHLLELSDYLIAETVFCFVPTGLEIDIRPLLLDALARGKRLCVPRCTEVSGVMELRAISSLEALIPGKYGILEPDTDSPIVLSDQVDFAVLPCVTCSRDGLRLGHGGGYYDRFLSTYRSGAVLVCRERQIQTDIPVGPTDIPVHWVVTEAGHYKDGIPVSLPSDQHSL